MMTKRMDTTNFPLGKCIRLFVQIVEKSARSPSNPLKAGRYIVGNVTGNTGLKDTDDFLDFYKDVRCYSYIHFIFGSL